MEEISLENGTVIGAGARAVATAFDTEYVTFCVLHVALPLPCSRWMVRSVSLFARLISEIF